MTLLELLDSKTDAQRQAFAKACGTSVAYLYHIAKGRKQVGVPLIINIERESKGAIRCEDLRPGIDWAYLRNSRKKRRAA